MNLYQGDAGDTIRELIPVTISRIVNDRIAFKFYCHCQEFLVGRVKAVEAIKRAQFFILDSIVLIFRWCYFDFCDNSGIPLFVVQPFEKSIPHAWLSSEIAVISVFFKYLAFFIE